MISRRLISFDDRLCASPAYFADRGVPSDADDLVGHDLVASCQPIRWPIRWPVRDGVAFRGLRACLVVPEPAAIRAMLIAGAGIGCVPDFTAAPTVAANELVRLWPDAEFGRHSNSIVSPSKSLLLRGRPFTNALLALLTEDDDR